MAPGQEGQHNDENVESQENGFLFDNRVAHLAQEVHTEPHGREPRRKGAEAPEAPQADRGHPEQDCKADKIESGHQGGPPVNDCEDRHDSEDRRQAPGEASRGRRVTDDGRRGRG